MIKSNVRIYCNKCQTVHKRKCLKQGLVSFEGKKKWLKKTPFDRYGCLMTIFPKMMTD